MVNYVDLRGEVLPDSEEDESEVVVVRFYVGGINQLVKSMEPNFQDLENEARNEVRTNLDNLCEKADCRT